MESKGKRSDSKESQRTTSTVHSQNYGDKANDQLYQVFKTFDTGKIDVDTFIGQIEANVGIPATPEFVSYIRTQKHTQCSYSKIAQTLNYKRDPKQNSTYNPPVAPFDQKFHRGQTCKVDSSMKSNNAYQEEMAKVLKDYSKGSINQNKFREELMNYKIDVDANLDKLIRRHEAGDFITYNEFGKHVFRQLNGSDTYNRVDKINMNNVKIVSPEKKGKDHFSLADEIKQPLSRDLDNHHIEQQQRYLSTVYVPKKAGGLSGVNQNKSSITHIINPESNQQVVDDGQQSNLSRRSNNLKYKKNESNIFGNDKGQDDSGSAKKKTNYQATAATNNGNILLWDK